MGLLVVSLFTKLHKIKFSQAISPHEYHNWTADCTASARKELIAIPWARVDILVKTEYDLLLFCVRSVNSHDYVN